ncbi:MAG: 1-phosphofructokinase [Clostridiales bacterium]|nr:1-phosphofructokinase [Clostridiales bacterium]
MIFTVTLNPALDKTVEIPSMTLDVMNRIAVMRTDPGGKGINVSKVIDKLGSKSIAAGILGGNTGRSILEAVEKMGIETDFLFVEGETRTNLKIVDPVLHTNTDINEPGTEVSKEVLDGLLNRVSSKVKKGDIVVLSGSIPKGAPKSIYAEWIKVCKDKGAKVFLDADGEQFELGLKASPYLIKPNNHELSALLKQKLETPEELKAAALELMKKYNISTVVVSMGGSGALYVTEGKTIYAEGLKVPVGSTVGAGDSVVAALAVSEERGLSLEETAAFSTATGAANVMCSGTQAAEYDVIEGLFSKVVYKEI